MAQQESRRKCSQCGNNGHNTRTCNGKGCFKLFGVNIMTQERQHEEAIRRTSSMGLLESRTTNNNNNVEEHARHVAAAAGYLSDGIVRYESRGVQLLSHERKKGQQWSDEEHSSFLVGLDRLGKGNWKSISKEYVPTRTPSQVASHAQKYYMRMLPASQNKKRRTSMFDKPLVKLDNTTQIAAANPSLSRIAEGPHVFPTIYPTHGVAQGFPYIVGVPGSGQRFPVGRIASNPNGSFVPIMNAMRPPYVYLPRAFGNFAAWAPISSQLSGVPSPSDLPPNQGTSTIERSFLDGKMASPLDPQRPESSQTSGAIRVT